MNRKQQDSGSRRVGIYSPSKATALIMAGFKPLSTPEHVYHGDGCIAWFRRSDALVTAIRRYEALSEAARACSLCVTPQSRQRLIDAAKGE